MTFPFVLGVGIAHGIYNEFRDEPGTVPIAYGTFVRLKPADLKLSYRLTSDIATLRWCCNVDYRVSRAVSHSDRAQIAWYTCWYDYFGCWCWRRRGRMGTCASSLTAQILTKPTGTPCALRSSRERREGHHSILHRSRHHYLCSILTVCHSARLHVGTQAHSFSSGWSYPRRDGIDRTHGKSYAPISRSF